MGMTKEEKYKLVHPLEGLKYPVVAESYDDTIVKEKLYTKDEVVAMLKEIKDEANNICPTIYNCASFSEGIRTYNNLIQQKINALRGE